MLVQEIEQPAPTFADPFWQAALERALRAADEALCVLVPAELLPLHPRFAPLEYSWGLQDFERLAWCCSKDDVDRLAPWLHGPTSFYAWSNEVFVLGGNFRWASPADAQSQQHLTAWHERIAAYRGGKPSRESRARSVVAGVEGERRVLVVGASSMGNIGDDLLAQVLAGMIADAGANVDVSGPDIDPLHIASYDAVIVGGGGLVYASRDGSNETQNLANYLKFGPVARHFGVPAALIGVGDQDHAGGIGQSELTAQFARAALAQFKAVTTRDADSAALLERLGAKKPRTGSDLLFAWHDRAREAVRPSTNQPRRIALAGEFYRFPAFAAVTGEDRGGTGVDLSECELDLLVMSNDDEEHAQRLKAALERAGASASIVNLRELDFQALVFLFASYRGVITTRFHGLVLAALTGTPVLAFDVPRGKLARLLNDLGKPELLVRATGELGAARLAAGLQGQLEAIPAERVKKVATLAEVHARTIGSLVTPLRTRLRRAAAAVTSSALRGGARPGSRKQTHPDADVPVLGTGTRPIAARSGSGPVAELDNGEGIALCWAASTEHTNGVANLGDSLSAVMVAALSGRPVRHVAFDDPIAKLVAVGSIGHAIRGGTAVVWGSGVSIRGGVLAQNVPNTRYDVRAIRGPISAQHYRDFGITVPDVFGDPVWLLPSIVDEPVEKKYELGVIPHIQDIERHHPDAPARADSTRYVVDPVDAKDVVIINTWHEPTWEGLLAKLRLIRSCKRIVSQSFHGVVIAETYGIPVLNFRYMLGAKNGPMQVDLNANCTTDPRIWEFYKGGARPHFQMYSQKRDERSDWEKVIQAVDTLWSPFEFDAAPLVESFPLPLAYDPLRARAPSLKSVEALRF